MSTRRQFLRGAAALWVASSFVDQFGLAEARAASTGCIWGVYSPTDADTVATQNTLARSFAGQRLNGGIKQPAPGKALTVGYDAGRCWSYRNIDCWTVSSSGQRVAASWADVAAGAYDAPLLTGARNVLSNPRWTPDRPFHLSFHHEQAVNTVNQPGDGRGTPTDYQDAYRHVRALYSQAGATVDQGGNVLFCFVPTAGMFQPNAKPGHRASEYDPGTECYELLGCDLYEHYASAYRRSAAGWLDPVHAYAQAVGKQFILGEVGIAELDDPSAKPGYIRDLTNTIQGYDATIPGSCAAILWTNVATPLGDYRMTSSTATVAAYTSAGSNSFFAAVA
jgi:hypothetical protein